jgi:hypothetical protein
MFDEDNVDIEVPSGSAGGSRDRAGFVRSVKRPYLQPNNEPKEPMVRDAFDNRRDSLIEHYFASRALFGMLN